jgi:hypothetical protein
MKPDPRNPNRMTDADKGRMKASLAEFGDLSGIVINRRTDQLVGGHQRAGEGALWGGTRSSVRFLPRNLPQMYAVAS